MALGQGSAAINAADDAISPRPRFRTTMNGHDATHGLHCDIVAYEVVGTDTDPHGDGYTNADTHTYRHTNPNANSHVNIDAGGAASLPAAASAPLRRHPGVRLVDIQAQLPSSRRGRHRVVPCSKQLLPFQPKLSRLLGTGTVRLLRGRCTSTTPTGRPGQRHRLHGGGPHDRAPHDW